MKHFLDLGAHKLEGLKEFTEKLNINKEWNVYSYEPNILVHEESEKIIETIKNHQSKATYYTAMKIRNVLN